MEDKLNLAISAIEGGDNDTAAVLLRMILAVDEEHEDAWLWLATITESVDEKRRCLARVLSINPTNREARRGLAALPREAPVTASGSQETILPPERPSDYGGYESVSSDAPAESCDAIPSIEFERDAADDAKGSSAGNVVSGDRSAELVQTPIASSIGTPDLDLPVSQRYSAPSGFSAVTASFSHELSPYRPVDSSGGIFSLGSSEAESQSEAEGSWERNADAIGGRTQEGSPPLNSQPSQEVVFLAPEFLSRPIRDDSVSADPSSSSDLLRVTEGRSYIEEIAAEPSNAISLSSRSSHSTHEESVGGSGPEEAEIAADVNSRRRRAAKKWIQPFHEEAEAVQLLPELIDEILVLAESIEPVPVRSVESLRYAKKRWQEAASLSLAPASFFAPSVQAAVQLAEILVSVSRYDDAFWIGNNFGEVCKILVARNRQKYQESFSRLLLVSLCAAAEAFTFEGRAPDRDYKGPEISRLKTYLENICRFALGTYFNVRTSRYIRNWQPDSALSERAVNEALARHFDSELRRLIQDDRPRVREYVTSNLPIIYRLKLDAGWDKRIDEWERLLVGAGYDDLIHYLRSTGLLVRVDKVGQLSQERLEDLRRAAANDDLGRVRELLRDSADELKAYLYSEAQARLDYRQPPQPHFTDKAIAESFTRAKRLAEKEEPRSIREALEIVQAAWERDISSLELRDWVAYLHAKTDNPKAAEPILEHIRKRRDVRQNFATIWNLAVLAYDRKDEATAYELLLPLLESTTADEDLILVVLALALKLDDRDRFLESIPRALSLKFHPLGIVLAHDCGDRAREGELLTQLLRQSQKWELPPINERFLSLDLFRQTVNRAIVEGQIDQLISWLEARTRTNSGWIPNYLALARVLEEEKQDIDRAFRVLSERLTQSRGRQRDQQRVDEAARDLLELCKRTGRKDLGQQAYSLSLKANAGQDLLEAFRLFAPEHPKSEDSIKVEPKAIQDTAKPDPRAPSSFRDPRLAERLAWVTARIAGIRNVSTYAQESQAIGEFGKIMLEMNPQESGSVVKIIRDISEVVDIFNRTDLDDHDTRRVLYDRTIGYEARLTDLLASGALTRALADVLTPYHVALKKVVGDLSRQAGIGPNIEASIENSFFSLEPERSTLALRVTNASERAASDVLVELLIDSSAISVVGRRERRLAALDSHKSAVLAFPVERARAISSIGSEIGLGVSLRASAEGFPNVDLGITKRSLPVKSMRDAIGYDQIPKLFQSGKPLDPAEPDLFQGRSDIIGKISGSFYGGIQRERFFLDGIRRVGKTSIINFLPLHLPDTVFPVPVNLDKFGLRGSASSATILQQFCGLISESGRFRAGIEVEVPSRDRFEISPGQAFEEFLSALKSALPGRAPFIMVDEFQELLYAVARTGSGHNRDTLVLDQIRGHSDEGRLYMVFTGSIRFDRLSSIIDHRIFGSLTRLRVSFLPESSVGDVLRAGFASWANIPPETVRRIFELTGGYPWLVQTYGAGLVDLLNRERRTVATPEDVDYVTADAVICNDELFSYWWPTEQLGSEEERFVEWLFRHYPAEQTVLTRDFFSSIHNRELSGFRRAFENLRACEVLDSTQTEVLRFSGAVMRQWLEQKMQDGQLKVRTSLKEEGDRGYVGIFVDHENLVKSLERVSRARGVDLRSDRLDWFSRILNNIVSEAEKRFGVLKFKVSVAFWERPQESLLLPAYFRHNFSIVAPEPVKMANAVDFKVASEVRRSSEQALREGTRLGRAIIVTGDGDLSHEARSLVNDGVSVQIWGGSRETNEIYRSIVGDGNIVVLDDVSGL